MKKPVKYKEGLNIYRQLDKYYYDCWVIYKTGTALQGNKLLPLRLTAIICISNHPQIYHLACSFTNSENFNQY